VIATLGAPERRLLRGRRARDAEPEPPPAAVTTGRATVIAATELGGRQAAERWLREADGEEEAAAALAVLNRALHLHRTASADPAAHGVAREQCLVVRVGIGQGEQVADGRWARALELPLPRRHTRRSAALRPQERLAALLGGRDAPLACEELALRARADVEAGRTREAALQLLPALDAALAELSPWVERAGLAERLAELKTLRPAVAAAYERALQGGLDDETVEQVYSALGRVEAALRARTAAGLE